MNKEESIIINFFKLMMGDAETISQLKELALLYYENGYLTESEHCDIEALLDEQLRKF